MTVETFIARQPIFDAELEVRGYELLHRCGWAEAFDGRDADQATVELLNGSLLVNRLQDLTDGRPGFINVPRNLLLLDFIQLLPPEFTVIEVLESVEPEPVILAALSYLRRRGYTIALDDFVDPPGYEPMVALADIVKVDFTQTDTAQRQALLARHRRAGLRFLAEKVETREEFEEARAAGFELFQGHFFCRPESAGRREVSGHRPTQVEFLKEVTRAELDLDRLEEIIKHDLTLTSKLLRYLNSAAFGTRREIRSIKHALIHLGEQPLRRWGTLTALAGLAREKPLELVRTCLVRARFCETLAQDVGLDTAAIDLYLTGLFSAIDALLDQPLEQALAEVGLGENIGRAIRGDDTPLSRAFRLAVACERGDWARHETIARELGLDLSRVAQRYAEALFWADQAFGEGGSAAA